MAKKPTAVQESSSVVFIESYVRFSRPARQKKLCRHLSDTKLAITKKVGNTSSLPQIVFLPDR